MAMDLKIGKVMKQIMEKERYSLASISRATGVPKSTLSEWQSNRNPNIVQASKVANHLGISLHFLLFGEEDAQQPLRKVIRGGSINGALEITVKLVDFED